MSGSVYVVMTDRGEYSDRDVWAVRVLATEAEAQAYCDALSAEFRAYVEALKVWNSRPIGQRPTRASDDRGESYWFEVCPLGFP